MVNRTQALVLGFFVVALGSLLVILVAAPEVYDLALRLPDGSGVAEVGFLVVLTGLIGLLCGCRKLIRLMRRGCTRGSRRRGDRVVGFVGWLVQRAGGGRPAVALGRGSGAAGVRCSAPRNSSTPPRHVVDP